MNQIFPFLFAAVVSGCAVHPPSHPETIIEGSSPLTPAQTKSALTGKVSFRKHIKPVLEAKCVYCHSGPAPAGGFNMTHPDAVFGLGAHGPRVKPGYPDESVLVANIAKTHGKVHSMPPVGNCVTEDELSIIRRWITQGAPWPTDLRLRP